MHQHADLLPDDTPQQAAPLLVGSTLPGRSSVPAAIMPLLRGSQLFPRVMYRPGGQYSTGFTSAAAHRDVGPARLHRIKSPTKAFIQVVFCYSCERFARSCRVARRPCEGLRQTAMPAAYQRLVPCRSRIIPSPCVKGQATLVQNNSTLSSTDTGVACVAYALLPCYQDHARARTCTGCRCWRFPQTCLR